MNIESLSFYDSETYSGLKSIWAIVKNREVGCVSYRIKDTNAVHIDTIWVIPEVQRKGIAKQLIERLIAKHGYKNIYWGRTTADGLRLKEYFDRLYGVNVNERVEHLDFEHTLRLFKTFNQKYYEYLLDLCQNGANDTLVKWRRSDADWLTDNQIAITKMKTIASWIRGSVMNTHAETDNMPRSVYTMINELGIPI